MICEISYSDMTELFLERIDFFDIHSGKEADSSWLTEFDESKLSEAERLNVILPLIKWCVDNNTLTEELKDELELYHDDYIDGKLDYISEEDEAEDIIRDLTACYKKVFG